MPHLRADEAAGPGRASDNTTTNITSANMILTSANNYTNNNSNANCASNTHTTRPGRPPTLLSATMPMNVCTYT